MSIKLEFISYTEIINKTYRNIYKDNTVKILTDYIPEINRFDIIHKEDILSFKIFTSPYQNKKYYSFPFF
mgnify:CR=1 FL=1